MTIISLGFVMTLLTVTALLYLVYEHVTPAIHQEPPPCYQCPLLTFMQQQWSPAVTPRRGGPAYGPTRW
jgi:hypothetical protein